MKWAIGRKTQNEACLPSIRGPGESVFQPERKCMSAEEKWRYVPYDEEDDLRGEIRQGQKIILSGITKYDAAKVTAALAAKDAEPKLRDIVSRWLRAATPAEDVSARLDAAHYLSIESPSSETPLTREPTSQETGDTARLSWMCKWGLREHFMELPDDLGQAREYIDTLRDTLRSQSPDEPRPSGIRVSSLESSELRQLRAQYAELNKRACKLYGDWQANCTQISELRTREQQMREALELAEVWLVNCMPIVEPTTEKPLPKIRAALALPAAQQQPAPAAEQEKWTFEFTANAFVIRTGGKPIWFERRGNLYREQLEQVVATHNAAPSPAQEKPVEASVQLFHYGGDNDVRLYAHDDQTKWLYLVRLDDPRHVIPFIDACNKAVNRALATASAPPAAAQETEDSATPETGRDNVFWTVDEAKGVPEQCLSPDEPSFHGSRVSLNEPVTPNYLGETAEHDTKALLLACRTPLRPRQQAHQQATYSGS
jgi:hypothetical protein